MDPEASVSALVFHHLDCTYFRTSQWLTPLKPRRVHVLASALRSDVSL
jgi:hypothetical protein